MVLSEKQKKLLWIVLSAWALLHFVTWVILAWLSMDLGWLPTIAGDGYFAARFFYTIYVLVTLGMWIGAAAMVLDLKEEEV